MMRIAFYASSLLSSYGNGAATYYRGVLSALAELGYDIDFYEPDAFDRQAHRDIEPPSWARVHVYPPQPEALQQVMAEAAQADIVVKASGVGVFDDELLAGTLAAARPDALRVFWDVDAPVTLADLAAGKAQTLRQSLPGVDLVLTVGGGVPLVRAYESWGAARCVPVYSALDPSAHFPVAHDPGFTADLSFLADRLPERESCAEEFFFGPAARLPRKRFLLGGSGWDSKARPANVRLVGQVGTEHHNAFHVSALCVLNVARDRTASLGFCPATHLFEAAGAGACLITDAWEGIELFLAPDREVLVVRHGAEVAQQLARLTPERARDIGLRARRRILAEHTYNRRAHLVDELFRSELARKHPRAAA